MENLSISDVQQGNTPRSGGQLGPATAAPLTGPPQLPPQMFTTAAQLLDLTDSEVLPPCLPQCTTTVVLSLLVDPSSLLSTPLSLDAIVMVSSET